MNHDYLLLLDQNTCLSPQSFQASAGPACLSLYKRTVSLDT